MRVLALVAAAALSLVGAARASDVRVTTLTPVEDVSLPFWCDWGYDWDERCYRDDGPRLAVGGGEPDKVWRSALRFSIPAGVTVVTAELSLWYDGMCVAPRKTSRPCDGRPFAFGAHPIFSPRWYAEREVGFGQQVGAAELAAFASPRWVIWDVTDLVAEWASGGLPNDGVLLKLVDGQEDYGVSGPLFPSSSYGDASLRPRLTVWYLPR
jgi:hypothetical protein